MYLGNVVVVDVTVARGGDCQRFSYSVSNAANGTGVCESLLYTNTLMGAGQTKGRLLGCFSRQISDISWVETPTEVAASAASQIKCPADGLCSFCRLDFALVIVAVFWLISRQVIGVGTCQGSLRNSANWATVPWTRLHATATTRHSPHCGAVHLLMQDRLDRL